MMVTLLQSHRVGSNYAEDYFLADVVLGGRMNVASSLCPSGEDYDDSEDTVQFVTAHSNKSGRLRYPFSPGKL